MSSELIKVADILTVNIILNDPRNATRQVFSRVRIHIYTIWNNRVVYFSNFKFLLRMKKPEMKITGDIRDEDSATGKDGINVTDVGLDKHIRN